MLKYKAMFVEYYIIIFLYIIYIDLIYYLILKNKIQKYN